MSKTPLQQLRQALNLVGEHQLRVRWSEESPLTTVIEKDQIVVVLSVTRRTHVKGGSKITHEGTRGYVFHRRTQSSGWYLADTIELVNKLDHPVYELSYGGVTEAEYAERIEHEKMCYRPGTSSFPMDGPMTRR